ncbi:MAG TPA: carboxypeptidase-like regulatory domain-containing protein [Solirubrobacteraceae bacterium]|nr:carboxypeptidase-like regulatory domain-containing protein [Solirubrobacteraceae bacterium]
MALAILNPAIADAGSYQIHQCTASDAAVSPGWSTYAIDSQASTVLTNSCGAPGGALGDYVFSNGQAGAVTENGDEGSQVGLTLNVPSSLPDITIHSISANVSASAVSGDDAFLGFASEGQDLPGASELTDGNPAGYTATDTWTLPQGARAFQAYVNCSTDHSNTTCAFAQSTSVPALSDIALTLEDKQPPTITAIAGALASAAASHATVSEAQGLTFTSADSDSGIAAAALTLTPQNGETPITHTFNDSAECTYDSWNACPTTRAEEYTLDTAGLKDDTYALTLTATDAADNQSTQQLGTISTDNAPTNTTPPTILPDEQLTTGTTLTAQPGTWSTPGEAGTVTYSYQWETCESEGQHCQPIPTAEQASYSTTSADAGHTLRVSVNASNRDGHTRATSQATASVTATLQSLPGPDAPGSLTATSTNTPAASIIAPGAPSGSANGLPASESAQLHLNTAARITRSYTKRTLTITGRLTSSSGQPIANATLDVSEQASGAGSTRVIAHGKTTAGGTFTIKVPGGPSRTITIGYRAYSADPTYAATAVVDETVTAGVQLHVSPRTTSPVGTITLSGRVAGPIPHGGITIELLVRYHHQWQPFRDPHTNSHGAFHVRYQFQGAEGRFPFRAQALRGQAGFPYAAGYSATVDISTR